jgi:D-beta-D-heptose 7-phosphate kinase/D-beta-D-heptose 1-phosphate adenosyltransferase
MYERLLKVIGNLGTPRILVVGDFMLDVYVYGDAVRISPEAPVPVLNVTETESRCGGGASVAADLAALGAVPLCIGVVGDDASGRSLRDRLIASGADVDDLLALPGRPTTTKQRVVGLAQHRHRQQLMRIDQEAAELLPPEIAGQILRRYRERLADVDVVCLQDYRKGLITPSLCQQMIGLAQTAGRKVLVDPAFGRDYTQYSGATVLTPNRREAGAAVGWEIQTPNEAGRAAEHLRGDLRLEAAVITLDKEGAYLAAEGMSELVPAKARTVYDVTGAGDAVLATLAVSLAVDSDYVTSGEYRRRYRSREVRRRYGDDFGDDPRDCRTVWHGQHEGPAARLAPGGDQVATAAQPEDRLHQRVLRRPPSRAHRVLAVLPSAG